jgi:hypothetical protein
MLLRGPVRPCDRATWLRAPPRALPGPAPLVSPWGTRCADDEGRVRFYPLALQFDLDAGEGNGSWAASGRSLP